MSDCEPPDLRHMVPGYGEDTDDGGEAIKKWAGQLAAYFDQQGPTVERWRQADPGERPYPAPNNPVFGYLIDRAREIVESEGPTAALIWLGAHAWFEGGLAEMTAQAT